MKLSRRRNLHGYACAACQKPSHFAMARTSSAAARRKAGFTSMIRKAAAKKLKNRGQDKMAMNIELFAGNCYLCSDTEKMIRKVIGQKCTLRTYNLAEGKNRQRAEKYGIRALPTIVGNGQKCLRAFRNTMNWQNAALSMVARE